MTDKTYMQCYGIHGVDDERFIPRSDLVQKSWAENSQDEYVELKGHWKDNSRTAIYENYFVVDEIDGSPVEDNEVRSLLEEISRNTIRDKYPDGYADNINFFASDNSIYGYEYPILSKSEAAAIESTDNPFCYAKVLRYAFAANYVYSIEEGVDNPFSYYDNDLFKSLMLFDGKQTLEIIDSTTARKGITAAAIRVPAVPSKGLEEEIIISYKGTNDKNVHDLLQDVELMVTNIVELDADWQKQAYDFCQGVIKRYPPNAASLSKGYQGSGDAESGFNVVLTGHSLGAYTAIDVGVRTGILTRVFSSPATRIIRKFSRVFSNQMRLNNVINFVRVLDPVSGISGRHDENMVYYPAQNSDSDSGFEALVSAIRKNAGLLRKYPKLGSAKVAYDLISASLPSHYLEQFIDDVLMTLCRESSDQDAVPLYMYITPDADTGAGLEVRVNRWGKV